jgi:y4mF family transcriptional regulator
MASCPETGPLPRVDFPVREESFHLWYLEGESFPYGKDATEGATMDQVITSAQELGRLVRQVRRNQGVTQAELAGASGVGQRFVVDLEKGKPTCELEKSLHIVQMLGIELRVRTP